MGCRHLQLGRVDRGSRRRAPTSLRVTQRRVVDGRDGPIEQILKDDFRVAGRIVGGHDFVEGARATLIDKNG